MEGRTKKAILNIGSNFIVQMIKTIFSFLTRTIFIYSLGKEALGLNGLYTNILSMLSLAELGIGTAINFSLYEPLAKKDEKKISALMSFYKKSYRVIGFIVAILGIILIPFLKYFIQDINLVKNAYTIYLLFLTNTVSSYFISYKETLINADQKNYKLTKINLIFLILINTLQIVSLLIYKNFIIYLCIQLIVQLAQRVVINIYITKEYSNIDFKSKDKVGEKDLSIIKKNVKAMIFHKIGDYCINGTDNLIISSFINIITVGLYSNYLTILTLITTFTNMFFSNLTAGLGNLVVTESSDKKYEIYKKMDFIGFIMYGFCAVILINVFNDFISFWVGNDYCLDFGTVIAIVISFYIAGMRIAPYTIKSAAGLYDVDKFTPLIQSVINLFVSIFLVRYLGLLGVVLGTIVSSIVVPSWQRPFIVYKYILNKPFKEYVLWYFKNIFTLMFVSVCALFINSLLPFSNYFVLFIVKSIITSIIYIIVISLLYRNTNEFKYLFDMFKKLILRRKV